MSATHSQPPAAGEAAHTPTPWIIQTTGAFKNEIWITTPRNESRIPIYENVAEAWTYNGTPAAMAAANAAFIVRACNSHAALVEALEIIAGRRPHPCPQFDRLETARDFAGHVLDVLNSNKEVQS